MRRVSGLHRLFRCILWLCAIVFSGGGALCAQTKAPAGSAPPAGMRKVVTGKATFVAYVPEGWGAVEGADYGARFIAASDPGGRFEAVLAVGTAPFPGDAVGAARAILEKVGRHLPDLEIANARVTPDRRKLVFDGVYSHPQKGRRELRSWVGVEQGNVTCSRIEAPAGRLEAEKATLLTVLANIRVLKGAFATGGAPQIPPLVSYRLRDGSASFQMPQGWKCQDFGKGAFIASDPGETTSFSVGGAEVLSPQLGVRVPGVVVAPYMPPHQAWRLLTEQTGLVSRLQFEKVIPRQDIAQEMARGVYTAGPVAVEELIYTCDVKGRRSKGYTFGFSFGSRLGHSWNFRHMTVGAPVDRFDGMVPTFSAMLQSFRFNEQWMANYIAQGNRRLQELQQKTASMAGRNAEDIRRMMQAAYDERQRSMDYIDYQRTNTIRGQQDWVSDMEGGTVYRTDNWGTRNTATGESWEGQPYDYVHFKGRNPKYNEQMTPIDSRALWERHRAK